MNLLKRTSNRARFGFLLGACIVTSLVLGVVALRASSLIQVGGPVYSQLVKSHDLVADILPPPHFIVESFATPRNCSKQPKRTTARNW